MNAVEVIDGGMLTTVQDLGRYGYQRYGVPTSGALDLFSLRAANRLVGNPDTAAGLEVTLVGPRLKFLVPATFALTGADLGARLDGQPLPRWQSVLAEVGAMLSFGECLDGMRAYLAIAGGIDVPVVLGSRSTYTRSKLGGVEGRPLKAGDVLHVCGDRPVLLGGALRMPEASRPAYGHSHTLRVVLGPQEDRFSARGIDTFLSSTYTVAPQSDRMGYRLIGPMIEQLRGPDIVSDGTPFGAVQVAGDGVPIILLADRGTAGGYTKIATAIGPDLPRLAQALPGDAVRFVRVDLEAAYEAVRERERQLESITATGPGADRSKLLKVAAAVAAVAARSRDRV